MESRDIDNKSLKPVTSPEPLFAKTLRRKHIPDDGSQLSVRSVETESSNILRRSVDRGSRRLSKVADKLERARSNASSFDTGRRGSRESAHSPTHSPGRRLSRLLHRRKKNPDNEDEAPEGLGLSHTNTIDSTNYQDWRNTSFESVGQSKSYQSSLLTDDSEPEPLTRPPLDSRLSHTGLLTLSSPLITAETIDTSQLSSGIDAATSSDTSQQSPGANTAASSGQNLAPTESGNTHTQLEEVGAVSGRNSSPVAKFKSNLFGEVKAQGAAPPTATATQAAQKLNVRPPSGTEVPSTVITPATPTFDSSTHLSTSPRITESPPPGPLTSASHRRVKSAAAGPTRLSAASIPILTPAVEEITSPGGSISQGQNSGGFFSSVFNVTQNAGNQFTSFFNSPSLSVARNRSFSNQEKTGSTGGEEVILPSPQLNKSATSDKEVSQEPAIATLGSGSLTLGQLGISEPSSEASMKSNESLSKGLTTSPTHMQESSPLAKSESVAAAQAIAAAYTDKASPATPSPPADQTSVHGNGRPMSISSSGVGVEAPASPQRSLMNGKEGSILRNNSVRSRISDRTKRKRHRNSSAATGSTSAIAAALAATHSAVANPAKGRLTGYPIANQKRNKDFHGYFKSVPEDDYLIEDYSAALQREILLHGRLYISERNVGFSSNIMGYVTTLVINFDEIMAMEKRNTAMLFPNAIMIQTLHAKNVFASLLNRDGTYDLLLNIWKVKHPNLKETETGHKLDNTAAATKVEAAESEDGSDDDESEGESGEDDDDVVSNMDADGKSIAGSEVGETSRAATVRAVSTPNGAPIAAGIATKTVSPDVAPAGAVDIDFPGPATHSQTECADSDTHYEKVVLDDTVPAPLGKIYSMMFGPLSGICFRKFLEDNESTEVEIEDDKKGLGEATKSNFYSYIKKLNGAIGPKQTKCLVNQTLDAFDLEKAVSVTCSTQTPDVPSGNVFTTKTRYCLTWGTSNSTRIVMTSGVEWSGKSWIKGPIEKGCESGQAQHGKDLVISLKSQLASKSPMKIAGKSKTKGKRKKTIESVDSAPTSTSSTKAAASKPANWGPLEPLHAILGPVGDMLGPLGNVTTILSVLLLIVTILWLRSPTKSAATQGTFMTPQRLTALEEMWRKEESELWNWLDDRLKLDEVYSTGHAESGAQQILRGREFDTKLEWETPGMTVRQVDDAIRVTEEKLASLKGAVERRRKESIVGKDEL